ncbi:MAG: PrsW family intramembrane metalloprotease [Anaerolineaceae bacterium]|nr:PrsW family intramembrane metalloprotease [Anaerolineaceae bacterium]
MGLVLSIFFGLTPMLIFAVFVYWLDRFEKEPKILLLAVFSWGAVVAAGLAFTVNSMLGSSIFLMTGSTAATQLTTGSLIAPIVEESLKGIGVLAIFLFFKNYFDSLLDGIVYSGMAALGFAATENIYYIYNYGFLHGGFHGMLTLVFIRVVMVGWQHPFFTAFTGIGLSIARLTRNPALRLITPIIGWGFAILAHSLHNTLSNALANTNQLVIGSLADWMSWALMFAFIVFTIIREQRFVSRELLDEVSLGIISPAQYRNARSPWAQSLARLVALNRGLFRDTNRFYQLCGVLAHKKRLRSTLGDEDGNTLRISNIRTELVALSPCVVTV